jgi:hypothetical protein
MSRSILSSPVYDKASALDLIFGFLQMAQRRGSFNFAESAKIYECMNQFSDFFEHEEVPEKDDEENVPKKEDDENEEENMEENDDEKFDSEEETN